MDLELRAILLTDGKPISITISKKSTSTLLNIKYQLHSHCNWSLNEVALSDSHTVLTNCYCPAVIGHHHDLKVNCPLQQ